MWYSPNRATPITATFVASTLGALLPDERVFELPVGFSERLHARIDLELQGTGGG